MKPKLAFQMMIKTTLSNLKLFAAVNNPNIFFLFITNNVNFETRMDTITRFVEVAKRLMILKSGDA